MAKIIKGYNYKKVSFGSDDYNTLSEFKELTAEIGKKGDIGIIDTDGSKKVRANKNLYTALGEPDYVKVFMSNTQVAFRAVPEGTPGAYEFCKGAVIYSTSLAEKIMEVASNVAFKPNATTRCGRIEKVQTNEDDSVTVILSFD